MNFTNGTFQLSATDLSNHLSCRHLTELNRKVALGELKRPHWNDPSLAVLEQRGREHEAAYVAFLESQKKKVVNIQGMPVEATLKLMAEGVDAIVQAKLEASPWMGYADVLVRVEGKSRFGDWSYEVQDTKLAQNTKATTILQLCIYTDLLAELQGTTPERFHVIRPVENFEPESYRFDDFKAYYRLTKRSLENTISDAPKETYPEPVEHCGTCRWWKVCDTQRHNDDYLSLVAGIRAAQIEELKSQGIRRLEDFARLERIAEPKRGNIETYAKRQAQAKIQLEGRLKNQLVHSDLAIEAGRGFNRLPEPDKGDVYFDIEGDAYYPDGGLEYILGYAFRDDEGKLVYKNHWSSNRLEEKSAFEQFMKFVMDRWRRFPNMYIYHFAPYEPTAVKRLARVHASYEKEVDELLRAEKFVDLHAVFKEALLASVETYSLKALELFTKYVRKIDLPDASKARKAVEIALELNDFASLTPETKKTTQDYNEDDCLATEALHVWLEEVRAEMVRNGKQISRLLVPEPETNDKLRDLEKWSDNLYKGIIGGLPEDRTQWTQEHRAKWLLAHLVDYFRREDKSAWWEHFRLQKLEDDDMLDERKGIAGLKFVQEFAPKGRGKIPTHRYTFPPQEMSVEVGKKLYIVNSKTEADKYGVPFGEVEFISSGERLIDIKKTQKTLNVHPNSVHVYERIDPEVLWTSIMHLASDIDQSGLDHKESNRAAKDLLMKRAPQLKEGQVLVAGEEVVAAAIRIAVNLDRSFLAIQGPPGSGKTHTGAKMIIELAKRGKRIGVTAISHKVIRNLIDKTIELSREDNVHIEFIHKVKEKSENTPDVITETDDAKKVIEGLERGKVAGGTAWLWADKAWLDSPLDYLFIDEAGQMSLSHALAASRAAHNLILLGDPQQLEQPQKGAHPEGSDVAALTYLLDGRPTLPEGRGLFLGTTRRLHPDICRFTSEIFYENKLQSLPGLENQVVSNTGSFDGAGLFYVPVDHRGNSNKSNEEIDAVAKIVATLLQGRWTDPQGKTHPITNNDILIVAPYNAQVSALSERLPGMRIGTVDKFQGQEAPVVIYSMTSSSQEDAPRGMSFLFSPNRLNVATSRAKSICILVASPRLLEPECRSIDQMKWANGLCRYVEMMTFGKESI